MLRVDTIYKIDTIYIQNKLDSISQLDMGQHINTIHSTYDSNMTIILWILGIAFGFIAFIIPYSLQLYDKIKFRNKIKEEVLDGFDKTIEEKTKKLEDKIEKEVKNSKNETDYYLKFIQSALSKDQYEYEEATKLLLEAAILDLDKADLPNHYAIAHNLDIIQNKLTEHRNKNHWVFIENKFESLLSQLYDKKSSGKYDNDMIDEIIETVRKIYVDNNSTAYLKSQKRNESDSSQDSE